jgi:hypothetical protein
MRAKVGDRLVIGGNRAGSPVRACEVVEVRHENGEPPYVVRWNDSGLQGLFFPGSDAYVLDGE